MLKNWFNIPVYLTIYDMRTYKNIPHTMKKYLYRFFTDNISIKKLVIDPSSAADTDRLIAFTDSLKRYVYEDLKWGEMMCKKERKDVKIYVYYDETTKLTHVMHILVTEIHE